MNEKTVVDHFILFKNWIETLPAHSKLTYKSLQPEFQGKDVNDVVELLAELEGTLQFTLIRGHTAERRETASTLSNQAMIVRALYDYEPADDEYLPCEELGLPFRWGNF